VDALNSNQISSLQTALSTLEADLSEQLQISEEAAGIVKLDQTLVGRVSRMDAMQQQNMAVSTRSKVQRKLQKVRLALAAIDSGDYGYCRKCDESIGYPRLNAQPEANLCLSCQDKADQQN